MFDISADPATPFVLGIVLAWLAGVRVYLTVFGVGVAAHFGWMELPTTMELAKSPWVIGVCGTLAIVEFCTDKLPGVDSAWDLVHTLVRIPAGAFVGGLALANGDEASTAGMILGGSVAALSHGLKTGSRAMINSSPEPVSNWTASFSEDGVVLLALWLVISHPFWALILIIVATIALVLLVVMLFRLARRVARRLRTTAA